MPMYEHSCKAGADGCGFTARAGDEEELKAQLGEDVRRRHGLRT